MITIVLAALLSPTQAGPLAPAREALAVADTARAVRLLQTVRADTAMPSSALAALLLQQWIGRSPSYQASLEHWGQEARRMRRAVGRNESARVLVYSLLVDRDARDREFERTFAGGYVSGEVGQFVERLAASDPLLVGAASWVLAQQELRRFGKELLELVPIEGRLPSACVLLGRRTVRTCTIRAAPPPAHTLRGLIAVNEALAGRIQRLRAHLDRAAGAPWPIDELALRTWVAVELFVGTQASARALVPRLARLPDPAVNDLRVLLGEFAGARDEAADILLGHPEHGALDEHLSAFGNVGMPPSVFWRVAWPLFLEPYNVRLVVHRARLLLGDLVRRLARRADLPFWQYGSSESVILRGIPLGMVRVSRLARGANDRDVMVEYLDPNMYETLVRQGDPDRSIALDLALAVRDESETIRAVSGYVPTHHGRILPFQHQVVQYVRDGKRHVDIYARRRFAVAIDARGIHGPPPCADEAPVTGLFLLDEQLGLLRSAVDSVAPRTRRHRFRLQLDPGTYVYSLELLDRQCRHAARARYVLVVDDPSGAKLSDLMLAEELRFASILRLVTAQPMSALPGLTVRAGGPARFYWEVYEEPVAEGESGRLEVSFEIVDVKQGRVGVGRLGQVAAAAARTAPVVVVDYAVPVPAGDAPLVMGLSVELPEDARGLHVARLRVVNAASGRTYTKERAFFIDPPLR